MFKVSKISVPQAVVAAIPSLTLRHIQQQEDHRWQKSGYTNGTSLPFQIALKIQRLSVNVSPMTRASSQERYSSEIDHFLRSSQRHDPTGIEHRFSKRHLPADTSTAHLESHAITGRQYKHGKWLIETEHVQTKSAGVVRRFHLPSCGGTVWSARQRRSVVNFITRAAPAKSSLQLRCPHQRVKETLEHYIEMLERNGLQLHKYSAQITTMFRKEYQLEMFVACSPLLICQNSVC